MEFVNPCNTSQICSGCGQIVKKRSIRENTPLYLLRSYSQ
ncbi:MAG: transposase [Methanosarcinaceae archaeon]|nr:transposase [Methanosarcinaceae archaeon]